MFYGVNAKHLITIMVFIAFIIFLPRVVKAQAYSVQSLITDPNVSQPSPFDNWKTLTTEHFRINYQQKHFKFAQRMAIIAEKVNKKVTKKLKWQPKGKTEIVINDTEDTSNGGATALPYNQFFILMNAPFDGELMDHTGWIELVFTHEYTHVIHLDQVSGTPESIRSVIGTTTGFSTFITYPELYAPNWLSEGIAVYDESHNGLGRGKNALFESKMRQEVLTGLRSFSEESYEGYNVSRWPFGQVYVYGTYFFQFVKDTYGEDKVVEYITNYNDNLIPWRMDSRSEDTFSMDNEKLWAKYHAYLKQRFAKQIKEINDIGVMQGNILVSDKFYNKFITEGPNDSIYYYHNDAVSLSTIKQAFTNGEQKNIVDLKAVNYLHWNKSSGLLIGRTDICDNINITIDLYVIKDGATDLQRITNCARLVRARWSKSGDVIYAVQVDGGKSSLVVVSLTGKIQKLVTLPYGDVIGDFDLSPIADKLVASVKRSNTGWNLEEFDITNFKWTKVTNSPQLERLPRYAANGRDVLFIADSKYQLEVKKLDVEKNEISTLTNSLGFIEEFVPVKDDSLWLVEYTGTNQQIRFIPKATVFGKTVKNVDNAMDLSSLITTQADFAPDKIEEGEDYSAWDTIKPVGWTPIFATSSQQDSNIGFLVEGKDILGFHQWSVQPTYYLNKDIDKFGGFFTYNYYNRISLYAESSVSILESDTDPKTVIAWDDEFRYQALVHYPMNTTDWSTDFAFGATKEKIKTVTVATNAISTVHNTLIGGVVNFNNLERFPHGISQTDGISTLMTVESYDANSDNSGTAVIAEFDGYIDVGGANTLKLSALYGSGGDNIKKFRLGSSLDTGAAAADITQLGRRNFALRGYDKDPQLEGTSVARAIIEWRMPIAMYYDGYSVFPMGIGKMWSNFFIDTGSVWNKGQSNDIYSSVGFEFAFELQIGFDSIILPITIGVAEGLDKNLGDTQFYLNTGIAL